MISSKELDKVIVAAKAGGAVISDLFEAKLQIKQKNSIADVVTQADVGSEKEILKNLHRDFSTYNFHSEEDGKNDNGSRRTFIIDPLDGTNNFVLGIPNFTVSIALVEDNRVIAGVIYAPMIDQTFFATEGGGSYLNDKQIFVGKGENINDATVSYTRNYVLCEKRSKAIIDQLDAMNVKRVLRNMSPAFDFCLIAKGTAEVVINDGTEIYDFAAGKIIAQEAGARIVDFDGNEDRDVYNNIFVVSNSKQNEKIILNMLNKLSY